MPIQVELAAIELQIDGLLRESAACRWAKFRDLPPKATEKLSARVQHIYALNSIRTRLEKARARLARVKARIAERAKHDEHTGPGACHEATPSLASGSTGPAPQPERSE